jgi:chemotaxis signal transduction protein
MSQPSLILRCAGTGFALPLESVIEVTRMVAPAAVLPRAPRYCMGAADYHGQLAPMIDLAARLGLRGPRSAVEMVEGRLIFVRATTGLIGLAVDEVPELSEKPVEPLASAEPSLTGLLRGVVRWREGEAAPVLLPGALLPVGAGVRLQKLVAAIPRAGEPAPQAAPQSPAVTEEGTVR